MNKSTRERYDNLPAIKQRKVRGEVMAELGYKYRSSFYDLLNGKIKRLTAVQSDVLHRAILRYENNINL